MNIWSKIEVLKMKLILCMNIKLNYRWFFFEKRCGGKTFFIVIITWHFALSMQKKKSEWHHAHKTANTIWKIQCQNVQRSIRQQATSVCRVLGNDIIRIPLLVFFRGKSKLIPDYCFFFYMNANNNTFYKGQIKWSQMKKTKPEKRPQFKWQSAQSQHIWAAYSVPWYGWMYNRSPPNKMCRSQFFNQDNDMSYQIWNWMCFQTMFWAICSRKIWMSNDAVEAIEMPLLQCDGL